MMRLLLYSLLTLSISFFPLSDTAKAENYSVLYSVEVQRAVDFYEKNHDTLKDIFPGLSEKMLKMIYSVVAPEVSQYDPFKDFIEVKALEMKYVRNGNCDYSIGRFQMKPSFVESLEKEVFNSASLKKKFGKYLGYATGEDPGTVRKERLKRMCESEWQMRYLAIFIEVAKRRTAKWGLKGNEEKLWCWATLYNAGPYLSRQRVSNRQKVKQFPRGTKEFNYSAVAVELYKVLLEL